MVIQPLKSIFRKISREIVFQMLMWLLRIQGADDAGCVEQDVDYNASQQRAAFFISIAHAPG